jgi:hypothetical protein
MFDIGALLTMLVGQFPFLAGVFFCLGLLIVVGRVLVAWTPTLKDDGFLAMIMAIPFVGPIINALVSFSPVEPK